MNSLNFNNVTLKFGGITALNDVSFEVKPKTLYAIIGPNGAGKTSIFNCISGSYRPTEGSVTYGDNNINKLALFMLLNYVNHRHLRKIN